MFNLTPESPKDLIEVETLYDLAFAPGRMALSSYRLREGVALIGELSLTARDETGGLAGAIRYWPVRIGATGHRALLLGPIAVHPTHQGEGLGRVLISDSLSRAVDLGWSRVLLIGDEPYYRRFGFARAKGLSFPQPSNPERLLFRALGKGAFDGVMGEVRRDKG